MGKEKSPLAVPSSVWRPTIELLRDLRDRQADVQELRRAIEAEGTRAAHQVQTFDKYLDYMRTLLEKYRSTHGVLQQTVLELEQARKLAKENQENHDHRLRTREMELAQANIKVSALQEEVRISL